MLVICSCSNTTPSGFWKTYRAKNLKEDKNNQGSQGGYRAMYWEAAQGAFTPKEIISYAEKNNWKIVDSIEVEAKDMNNWTYNGKPIFPLTHEGFSVRSLNSSVHNHFPRWISAGSKVYMFKTSWIVIEPGTNESNDMNGFVLLNNDGSEMSVYHIWGE